MCLYLWALNEPIVKCRLLKVRLTAPTKLPSPTQALSAGRAPASPGAARALGTAGRAAAPRSPATRWEARSRLRRGPSVWLGIQSITTALHAFCILQVALGQLSESFGHFLDVFVTAIEFLSSLCAGRTSFHLQTSLLRPCTCCFFRMLSTCYRQ